MRVTTRACKRNASYIYIHTRKQSYVEKKERSMHVSEVNFIDSILETKFYLNINIGLQEKLAFF